METVPPPTFENKEIQIERKWELFILHKTHGHKEKKWKRFAVDSPTSRRRGSRIGPHPIHPSVDQKVVECMWKVGLVGGWGVVFRIKGNYN